MRHNWYNNTMDHLKNLIDNPNAMREAAKRIQARYDARGGPPTPVDVDIGTVRIIHIEFDEET